MDTLHLTAKVDGNRRIVIDLPPDVEIGAQVDLTITPHREPTEARHGLTREKARAIWQARGWQKKASGEVPADYVPLSDEEILRITDHLKGSFSLDDMINEDRGSY